MFAAVADALLGSGAEGARDDGGRDEWWREELPEEGAQVRGGTAAAVPQATRQARLFDEDGEISGDVLGGGAAVLGGTQVEVVSGARARVRGVAVTRARVAARAATSAAALERERAAAGSMTRALWRSRSISCGGEEPRWYSVPLRGVLLPRYQLFDSADAVEEVGRRLTVVRKEMRVVHGRVWFG